METIRAYVNSVFSTLPKTKEIKQLQEDMLLNMEEKYFALKEEGKNEQEAIGTVISEFGNIEEVAREMGIDLYQEEQNIRSLDEVDAKQFLALQSKSRKFTSLGVTLCIIGASILVLLSDMAGGSIGVIVLLLLAAVAVGLFIYSGFIVRSYSFLEDSEEDFILLPQAKAMLRQKQETAQRKKTKGLVVGIGIIILGVVALIASSTFSGMEIFGVFLLLVFASIGVPIIICADSNADAIDKLLQQADYTASNKRKEKTVGAIAAIWWPSTVAVFLLISFLAPIGFDKSWLIWPVSAVLFAGVIGFYTTIKDKE